MSLVGVKRESVCTSEPLAGSAARRRVALFRSLLSSCYGPRGGVKLVHNSAGGACTPTTTSTVLLQALGLADPLLRLVTSAVLRHVTSYGDCGLLAGLLCAALVENALGAGLSPGVAAAVYGHLCEESRRFLGMRRVALDLGVASGEGVACLLLRLAHGVIASKPAAMLSPREARHVARLVVRAFLRSIPEATPGDMSISGATPTPGDMSIPGATPTPGASPTSGDMPIPGATPTPGATHAPGATPTARLGRTLTVAVEGQAVTSSTLESGLLVEVLEAESPQDLRPGPYKVVVFGASLSGEVPRLPGVLEAVAGGRGYPEDPVLEGLLELGVRLLGDGVGMLACQRVVHPALRNLLRERRVVVMERLGRDIMEPLARATGAAVLVSLRVCDGAYGRVSGLRLQRRGGRTLLQLLSQQGAPFSTMVLCHRSRSLLEELQVTCVRAERVLRQVLQEPYALCGGGCAEEQLLLHLQSMSEMKVDEDSSALGCSRSEYLLGSEAFCRSLRSVVLSLRRGEPITDPPPPWGGVLNSSCPSSSSSSCPSSTTSSSCCCGVSEESPLDSYSAKLNAVSVAVETASLILDVKYVVTDVN